MLLYTKDQTETNLFFKLKYNSGKFYTKSELKNDLKYPIIPSQDMYLVYQIDPQLEKKFVGLTIDLSILSGLG